MADIYGNVLHQRSAFSQDRPSWPTSAHRAGTCSVTTTLTFKATERVQNIRSDWTAQVRSFNLSWKNRALENEYNVLRRKHLTIPMDRNMANINDTLVFYIL